jgi:phosphoglycolate phosphatase-like HAD superfamily hydrolase
MPLDVARIAAVLFDVDGTLSDTDNAWVGRVERFLHPLRGFLPGGQTALTARWLVMGAETPGNILYQLLDHLHLDDEAARLGSWFNRHTADRAWGLPVIHGVPGMLLALQARYPLAVVSARGEASTRHFLSQHGLLPLFGAVATAQTCRHTKPFPDPLLWAAERLGVDPSRCLMVGDTTVDIRAGQRAGAQTAAVLCGFGTERELRRANPSIILDSTARLTESLGITT